MSMDASMIAHEWAHGRDRKYARSNVFAESGTIYSYGRHFPMARFYDCGQGNPRVVLYTSHSYSVSTARHLSEVRQAVRGSKMFTVDKVCNYAGGDLDKAGHKANHKVMIEDVARLVGKSKSPRIRPATVADLLARAEAARIEANEYRKLFKLGGRDVASIGVAADKIAAAERAAKRAADKAAARRKAEAAERFAKWCAGAEDVRASGFSEWPVAFRLKPGSKGRIVDSSLGAEIVSRDAVRAWRRLCDIRAGILAGETNGADYVVSDEGRAVDCVLEISGFKVQRISPAGFIVGCHNVSWEAAENLARLLGVGNRVEDVEPAASSARFARIGREIGDD